MGWSNFKKSKWYPLLKVFGSLYVLVLTAFLIWMVFFDTNSLKIHLELNQEIEKLQKTQEFLKEEIAKDKKIIEQLSDPKQLEKFAREQYFLKKKNEEIYLIEYEDSLRLLSEEER